LEQEDKAEVEEKEELGAGGVCEKKGKKKKGKRKGMGKNIITKIQKRRKL
jgi:hypothetical protein